MAQADSLPRSTVAVVRARGEQAKDLQTDEIRRSVREAVELAGGLGGLIRDGQTVVIKPNLISNRDFCLPGWGGNLLEREMNGVTADWRLAKAVVELVRELNPSGRVLVLEGSIVPTAEVLEYFHYTPEFIPGVDAFLPIEEDSGAWGDFGSPGLTRVELPRGRLHKQYYLNRKYAEADVLISIPCMKNHWNACVTGSVKNVGIGATPGNVYGIASGNPARNAMADHDTCDLHTWIHDFYLCRPVDFTVMDALQGCQNGPVPSFVMNGTTDMRVDQKNMRLVLAGRDGVALDTVESLLMGWDPLSVPYLTMLSESGAGVADVARIDVAGCCVDGMRKPFEGLTPPAGGSKITQWNAPQARLENASIENGELRFSLAAGEGVVKAEAFLDGKRIGPVLTENFCDCGVHAGAAGPGRHELRVWAYDRFLNRGESIVEVEF